MSGAGRDAVLAAALQGDPTVTVVASAVDADGLEEALGTGMLVVVDDERLRFAHPLFAEAATSLAGADPLRAMHLRLASLLTDQEERAQHLALGTSEPEEDVAATLDRAAEAAHRQRSSRISRRARGASCAAHAGT